MWKENLKQYIAPIIVEVIIGVFLALFSVFVIDSYHDHQETKEEIDYHFDQANNLLDEGQFEEAIGEYTEISKNIIQ